jgi:hypothetical protein
MFGGDIQRMPGGIRFACGSTQDLRVLAPETIAKLDPSFIAATKTPVLAGVALGTSKVGEMTPASHANGMVIEWVASAVSRATLPMQRPFAIGWARAICLGVAVPPSVVRGRRHPCFAMRLVACSDGKGTQGWRHSSHTEMVGGGKLGSAKVPIATAITSGKPVFSQ